MIKIIDLKVKKIISTAFIIISIIGFNILFSFYYKTVSSLA